MIDYDPSLDWKDVRDGGFNSHIGPLKYARGDDGWYCAIQLDQRHINFGGVCHGGVCMALADVCMGVGAHSSVGRTPCATIDFEAHFLAAAKEGQWLVGRSRLNRAVSGVIFMDCELWAGGRQVMRASGIWKMLGEKG